jgi:hypothetical protein
LERVSDRRRDLPRQHAVVTIEAPRLRKDKKKRMVENIVNAIDEAYAISDTLIFIHEDPQEYVAVNGILQSENLKLLEALRTIASCWSGKSALDFTTRKGCTR